MKESIRNTKSRYELSKNSRDIKKIMKKHRLKKMLFYFICVKWLSLMMKHLLKTTFIQ